MNWEEYSKLALRTESIPQIHYTHLILEPEETVRATRLMHAAAGLVTETEELLRYCDNRNLIEELGDCFWYLPIIIQYFPDLTVNIGPTPFSQEECKNHLRYYAAELVDAVIKRHIIYKKPLDEERVESIVGSYIYHLGGLIAEWRINVEEIWEANIAKLAKRYPDLTFNSDHAVNRDVENELSHISVNTIKQKVVDEVKDAFNRLTAGILLPDNSTLTYESHPDEVTGWVLNYLGCTRNEAEEILGEAFTRAKTTIMYRHENAQPELRVFPYETESEENSKGLATVDEILEARPAEGEAWYMDKEEFKMILLRTDQTKLPNIVAGWCLTLANLFRDRGASALAEGLKHAYVKVEAAKGSIESRANEVLEDAWELYSLLNQNGIGPGYDVRTFAEWVRNGCR